MAAMAAPTVVDLTTSHSSDDSGMSDIGEHISTSFATESNSATTAAAAPVVVTDAAVTELDTLVTIRNGIRSTLNSSYSSEQQVATIKWLVEKTVPQHDAVVVDAELANLRIMIVFIRDTLATTATASSKLATVRVALL
jgi:hypothetical protein